MRRRIVSIWFPKLSLDRLARTARHEWAPKPLAVVADAGNRVLVANVNADAEQAGIAPGMSLTDARTLLPSLASVRADPRADATFLKGLARWCNRFTPLIALDAPDGLFLDVTGCARLFGGEEKLMAAIRESLPRLGLHARVSLADTAGAAWALAHFSGHDGMIAPEGRARDTLRGLPVEALRLDGDTCATLKRLGLNTIGDLYPLQSAALAKRFGRATLTRLRQALGAEPEPLETLSFRPPYVARMGFAEPIGLTTDVAAALDILTARLCRRLDRERMGCRRIAFTIERVDGSSQSIVAGTSAPVNRPEHLTRLVGEHLDGLDAGFGIERAEVAMPRVEPREDVTLTFSDGAVSSGLPALLDRIGNRIGFEHVLAFAPADSHIPERAFTTHAANLRPEEALPWPQAERPLRLLTHPEPLSDVTATGFRLKGREHRIAWREGPERIAPEWWWDDPAWRSGARDYWQVEDEGGLRLWLFETSSPEPGLPPRWFLHGLFS